MSPHSPPGAADAASEAPGSGASGSGRSGSGRAGSRRPELSAVIIARDEGDRIGRAIASVSFADEVLVLDSGSTDDTVAVARALGARVVQTDWPGHVAQKNRAVAEAAHAWVISLDADEWVPAELASEVQAALERPLDDVAGFSVPRLSHWLGGPLRHGTWYPDRRVRLFHRERGAWTGIDPHDHVQLAGPERKLRQPLHHAPYRDLSEHLDTIDRYTARWAEQAVADGVVARWWDVALRPVLHIVKAVLLKAAFLDGVRGLCVAGLGATYVLVKWTRVWLRTHADPASPGP